MNEQLKRSIRHLLGSGYAKIPDEDLKMAIKHKMLKNSNTIKNCCVFFAVVLGIGLFFGLIAMIEMFA